MTTTVDTLIEDIMDLCCDPESDCYTLYCMVESTEDIRVTFNAPFANKVADELKCPDLVSRIDNHCLIIDKGYEYDDQY